MSELDDDAAMALALEEAAGAPAHGDVPIGCVILVDGAVVARRHNERELTGDPTAHAEVLALRVADRAERVVFGAADPKAGAIGSLYNLAVDPRLHHDIAVTSGVRADEAAGLVQGFFSQRREVDR